MLSKTRPAGWLAEACRVQAEGLCGHPEALSYPYDTCLWAGEIPRMGKHGQDWWRYEQTAYYVDGLLRLGYATGDESFIKKGEENIDYVLEHAAPDGHLGHPSLWDATRYKLKNGYDMWPLAVFFRAMKAKYDAAPDERIPAALQKNFLNYDKERVSKFRNVINAEGLLWTYAHTGDKRLLDLAEDAWNLRKPLPPEKKNELAPKNCANNDAIHMHGVSYCEEMKVPMILYAYTGKKEYLNQAVNVERKLVRDHMLPDGCPTSAERTLGNSVHVCHETCDVADYTWSLGYFLETTGDAAYADRMERCVFNAGFGAIAGDFKSLQYFSNVNQFIATSNSDHNPQNYGTTWMQYRPTQETECCAGNVNRILPNYISRMWLKDKEGGPVAALYGPSEVDFGWAKIKEETNYPFDGKVVFRFSMAEPKESAFTYRVPGWCKGASVKVNGAAVAAASPGSFATIGRRFADGDVIELDLPMDVRFEEVPRRFVVDGKDVAKRLVKRPAAKFANSSQGTVVTRGPLVFAYPIPTERTEDAEEHANMNGKKSANPDFKSWNLKPAGPFNYALAARRAEVVGDATAGDGFFKNPGAIKLRVSVRRIEWELDENRFTPDLPERPVIIGDGVETIELVPYGLTMLRLGVFPDVSQETFAATVWRGETAYVDIPAGVSVARLASQAKDGVSVALGYFDEVAYEMQPDGVDIRRRPDVYREDARRSPTVARVAVAPDAKPGVYNFGPFEVRVLNRVLPPAKDWKYFLDLWQHPWAVSRYFGVEPFSKEHYAKMEPIWRALADCGCKALTVTLLDLPWNHQCYDGYCSMVGRVRKADGTWIFDYKVFDEYVEFGRKCGLGPDIACYTMCPWKYNVTWKEEKCENVELCKYENMEVPNGVRTYVERREKFLPGTPEFEDYWGPFLVDFAAHLKEKGWFEDAYIAMDERGPDDVKKIVDLIQAKAPGMKVAICGKTKPSAFAGIQIENFCQGLIHLRDDFLPELAPRRAKGYKTTFYVCSSAKHPNTFMESPRDEGFYLGAYPVMIGFDGFLRWAANSWGENPYKDASFRTKDWKAGDAFLIYPGGELSQRLIDLRAGVVAAEKMRILRECENVKLCKYGNMKIPNGGIEDRIASIAKRYHYFPSVRDPSFDFAAFRREVEALVNSERCADLSSGAFAKSEAATALKVEDLKRLKRELAVPCETNGWGQLFVRCQVNGAECRLLVDTCCSCTFFDMPFVERAFGRDAVRSVKDPRAATSNIDSIRKSGAALKLHGVSVSISGVEFGGLDVTVIDGDWDSDWDEKDGILGLDVLGSVPTLVSVGDRKLVFNLRERKGFKSFTAGGFVPGGEDICSFFGIVNGKPVSFLLDTGGNMTQLMGGQGWQWKPGTKGESQEDNINGSRKVEMAWGMPASVTACDVDISLKSPLVKFGDRKHQRINDIGVDTLKDYDILVWDRYFYSVRPRDAKLREDVSPVFLDLDFDTTAAPDLEKWTRIALGGARYMRNAVSAVAICITSGWPVPRRVKVAYVDDDRAPPVRIADGTPADVYLNAKWFRENKDGEAAGAFFRALVQVMQGYGKTLGATEENCPKWLAEGIAEYAKCYIFDRYSGKRDYSCDNIGACRYRDSCRATASFLDFVERNHRGTLVMANAALRAHAFDDGTFWKDATGMTADELEKLWRVELAVVAPVAFADAKVFCTVSPDGKNELRLEVDGNGMEYSVWRSGKSIVEPARIALKLDGHGWLNGADAKPKATTRKVEGTLATPLYKKSAIDLAANETHVDFGDWAVRLHARNDGVAWRFETKFDGEISVNAESTNIRFPKETELCYTVASGFMSGWEKPAQIGPVESIPAGHPQIVMTPFTATVPGVGVVTVTESDLRDYPGLNFYRREGETNILRSWQAGVPKELDKGRRKIKVVSREPYLAKTNGTRTFPWRVFVLGDTPSDLVESDVVYALATPHSQLPHSSTPHSQLPHSQLPNSSTDFSWVKPGQVAWDWWNGFQITDVPGLATGCNFETYKEYVNFAAANGIAYIIMDEGWSEKLNLDKPRDEVNVPGVIAYAKENGVGVILWAAWSPLTDRETRLRVFDRYAAMGAKGFKIDFIERDDQDVERFLEETAADAAERKLVVLFHGIHKPTGLQRTYPNILNYEGVYGLEQGGRSGGRKVVISNDVNLVYTRMVAGFMDYTPGAMRNRTFDAPPFDPERDTRACYGTRCHQLALFPLFEAPIQMLCDSPTQYRTAPECTAFITKVPTVWDATVGVAGEIGKFAAVARRKDGDWWLGAITNWEARDVELPTVFLGEGEWKVEAFEDASDADVNAEHYVRHEFTIKAGEPLKVRLAPGGGFAARFTR